MCTDIKSDWKPIMAGWDQSHCKNRLNQNDNQHRNYSIVFFPYSSSSATRTIVYYKLKKKSPK